jgi:hypothetical protein
MKGGMLTNASKFAKANKRSDWAQAGLDVPVFSRWQRAYDAVGPEMGVQIAGGAGGEYLSQLISRDPGEAIDHDAAMAEGVVEVFSPFGMYGTLKDTFSGASAEKTDFSKATPTYSKPEPLEINGQVIGQKGTVTRAGMQQNWQSFDSSDSMAAYLQEVSGIQFDPNNPKSESNRRAQWIQDFTMRLQGMNPQAFKDLRLVVAERTPDSVEQEGFWEHDPASGAQTIFLNAEKVKANPMRAFMHESGHFARKQIFKNSDQFYEMYGNLGQQAQLDSWAEYILKVPNIKFNQIKSEQDKLLVSETFREASPKLRAEDWFAMQWARILAGNPADRSVAKPLDQFNKKFIRPLMEGWMGSEENLGADLALDAEVLDAMGWGPNGTRMGDTLPADYDRPGVRAAALPEGFEQMSEEEGINWLNKKINEYDLEDRHQIASTLEGILGKKFYTPEVSAFVSGETISKKEAAKFSDPKAAKKYSAEKVKLAKDYLKGEKQARKYLKSGDYKRVKAEVLAEADKMDFTVTDADTAMTVGASESTREIGVHPTEVKPKKTGPKGANQTFDIPGTKTKEVSTGGRVDVSKYPKTKAGAQAKKEAWIQSEIRKRTDAEISKTTDTAAVSEKILKLRQKEQKFLPRDLKSKDNKKVISALKKVEKLVSDPALLKKEVQSAVRKRVKAMMKKAGVDYDALDKDVKVETWDKFVKRINWLEVVGDIAAFDSMLNVSRAGSSRWGLELIGDLGRKAPPEIEVSDSLLAGRENLEDSRAYLDTIKDELSKELVGLEAALKTEKKDWGGEKKSKDKTKILKLYPANPNALRADKNPDFTKQIDLKKGKVVKDRKGLYVGEGAISKYAEKLAKSKKGKSKAAKIVDQALRLLENSQVKNNKYKQIALQPKTGKFFMLAEELGTPQEQQAAIPQADAKVINQSITASISKYIQGLDMSKGLKPAIAEQKFAERAKDQNFRNLHAGFFRSRGWKETFIKVFFETMSFGPNGKVLRPGELMKLVEKGSLAEISAKDRQASNTVRQEMVTKFNKNLSKLLKASKPEGGDGKKKSQPDNTTLTSMQKEWLATVEGLKSTHKRRYQADITPAQLKKKLVSVMAAGDKMKSLTNASPERLAALKKRINLLEELEMLYAPENHRIDWGSTEVQTGMYKGIRFKYGDELVVPTLAQISSLSTPTKTYNAKGQAKGEILNPQSTLAKLYTEFDLSKQKKPDEPHKAFNYLTPRQYRLRLAAALASGKTANKGKTRKTNLQGDDIISYSPDQGTPILQLLARQVFELNKSGLEGKDRARMDAGEAISPEEAILADVVNAQNMLGSPQTRNQLRIMWLMYNRALDYKAALDDLIDNGPKPKQSKEHWEEKIKEYQDAIADLLTNEFAPGVDTEDVRIRELDIKNKDHLRILKDRYNKYAAQFEQKAEAKEFLPDDSNKEIKPPKYDPVKKVYKDVSTKEKPTPMTFKEWLDVTETRRVREDGEWVSKEYRTNRIDMVTSGLIAPAGQTEQPSEVTPKEPQGGTLYSGALSEYEFSHTRAKAIDDIHAGWKDQLEKAELLTWSGGVSNYRDILNSVGNEAAENKFIAKLLKDRYTQETGEKIKDEKGSYDAFNKWKNKNGYKAIPRSSKKLENLQARRRKGWRDKEYTKRGDTDSIDQQIRDEREEIRKDAVKIRTKIFNDYKALLDEKRKDDIENGAGKKKSKKFNKLILKRLEDEFVEQKPEYYSNGAITYHSPFRLRDSSAKRSRRTREFPTFRSEGYEYVSDREAVEDGEVIVEMFNDVHGDFKRKKVDKTYNLLKMYLKESREIFGALKKETITNDDGTTTEVAVADGKVFEIPDKVKEGLGEGAKSWNKAFRDREQLNASFMRAFVVHGDTVEFTGFISEDKNIDIKARYDGFKEQWVDETGDVLSEELGYEEYTIVGTDEKMKVYNVPSLQNQAIEAFAESEDKRGTDFANLTNGENHITATRLAQSIFKDGPESIKWFANSQAREAGGDSAREIPGAQFAPYLMSRVMHPLLKKIFADLNVNLSALVPKSRKDDPEITFGELLEKLNLRPNKSKKEEEPVTEKFESEPVTPTRAVLSGQGQSEFIKNWLTSNLDKYSGEKGEKRFIGENHDRVGEVTKEATLTKKAEKITDRDIDLENAVLADAVVYFKVNEKNTRWESMKGYLDTERILEIDLTKDIDPKKVKNQIKRNFGDLPKKSKLNLFYFTLGKSEDKNEKIAEVLNVLHKGEPAKKKAEKEEPKVESQEPKVETKKEKAARELKEERRWFEDSDLWGDPYMNFSQWSKSVEQLVEPVLTAVLNARRMDIFDQKKKEDKNQQVLQREIREGDTVSFFGKEGAAPTEDAPTEDQESNMGGDAPSQPFSDDDKSRSSESKDPAKRTENFKPDEQQVDPNLKSLNKFMVEKTRERDIQTRRARIQGPIGQAVAVGEGVLEFLGEDIDTLKRRLRLKTGLTASEIKNLNPNIVLGLTLSRFETSIVDEDIFDAWPDGITPPPALPMWDPEISADNIKEIDTWLKGMDSHKDKALGVYWKYLKDNFGKEGELKDFKGYQKKVSKKIKELEESYINPKKGETGVEKFQKDTSTSDWDPSKDPGEAFQSGASYSLKNQKRISSLRKIFETVKDRKSWVELGKEQPFIPKFNGEKYLGAGGVRDQLTLDYVDKFRPIKNLFYDVKRHLGDNMEKGSAVYDSLNTWGKIHTYLGIGHTDLEQARLKYREPIAEAMRETGVAPKDVGQYLQARMAPNRNIHHRKQTEDQILELENEKDLDKKAERMELLQERLKNDKPSAIGTKEAIKMVKFLESDEEGNISAFLNHPNNPLQLFYEQQAADLQNRVESELIDPEEQSRMTAAASYFDWSKNGSKFKFVGADGKKSNYSYAPMQGFEGEFQSMVDAEKAWELLGQGTKSAGKGFDQPKYKFMYDGAFGRYGTTEKDGKMGVLGPDPEIALGVSEQQFTEGSIRSNKNTVSQSFAQLHDVMRRIAYGVEEEVDTPSEFNGLKLDELHKDENIRDSVKKEYDKYFKTYVQKVPKTEYVWEDIAPEDEEGTQSDRLKISVKTISNAFKDDPHVFVYRKGGIPHYIQFQENVHGKMMAASLKNMRYEAMPELLKVVGEGTRFMSQVFTSKNPYFIVPNFIKDYGAAAINLSEDDKRALVKDALSPANIKKFGQALFKAERVIQGDRKSPVDVDAIKKMDAQEILARGDAVEMYMYMKQKGGLVGYFNAKSVPKLVEDMLKDSDLKSESFLRRKWRATAAYVNALNSIAENSIRVSTFWAAIKDGRSTQEAALISRNVTVDFNQGGNKSNAMNSVYMFFRAAVNGIDRSYRTLKHRTLAQRWMLVGQIVGASYAIGVINRLIDDDEDEETEPVYDQLSAHQRHRKVVIPFPKWLAESLGMEKKARLTMIDIPLGLPAGLWGAGQSLADLTAYYGFGRGGAGLLETAGNLTQDITDVVNPLGSGSFLNLLTPSLATPFMELESNKDFMGRKIVYDQEQFGGTKTPPHERDPKRTPWFFNWFSEQINKAGGGSDASVGSLRGALGQNPLEFSEEEDWKWDWSGNQIRHLLFGFLGGPIRTVEDTFITMDALFDSNKEVDLRSVPVVSRFVRNFTYGGNTRNKLYNLKEAVGQAEQLVKDAPAMAKPEAKKFNAKLLSFSSDIAHYDRTRQRYRDQKNKIEASSRIEHLKLQLIAELEAKELELMTKIINRAQKAGLSV